MNDFRLVPDIIRNREPIAKGRKPASPLSKSLLAGKTVFVSSGKKTWGSLYRLAKNHNMKARIKYTNLNGEDGYVIWFESELSINNE